MALAFPPRKSFTASGGHEYSYVHVPARGNEHTLFFLHGFPSQLYDWAYQIHHFSSLGYGVLACDLLGYGESSKPADVQCYRFNPMSDDLVELLDSLHLNQVVGVGHDVGSTVLSRFAAHHPSRFSALVFLAVGPPKLGTPFNCEMINTMTKQMMGFELLGYISWMGGDEDAQGVLEAHPEATMSLMFPAESNVWTEWFHPLGKMKEFVTQGKRVPIGKWYPEELQQRHLDAFAKKGGYTGVVKWYRMWLENLFAPDEEGLEATQLTQPSLFVVPREPAAAAAQQQQMLAEWTPKLTVVPVESGHWVHLERTSETNAAIEKFLKDL